MMEKVTLTWADQTPNDAMCDDESLVTAQNFDVVPNASGNYTGVKPTIIIDCTDTSHIPTGFSWTFDIGGDNWPKSMTVVVYYQSGGSTTIGGFVPQAPTVYDTWTQNRYISQIVCTINSAHKGGEPLLFAGFHFGKCFTFPASAIKSLKIASSADFSGCSAPYATLSAVIYGRGAGDMLGHHSKIVVNTNIKRNIGVFYVTSLTSTYNTTGFAKKDYFTIQAVSALGILAEQIYAGKAMSSSLFPYTTWLKTKDVLQEISGQYVTDFSHFSTASGYNYYWGGIIPENLSRRDALARIANAFGCWVDENGVVKPWKKTGDTTIQIPSSRVYAFPVVSPTPSVSELRVSSYINWGIWPEGTNRPAYAAQSEEIKSNGLTYYAYRNEYVYQISSDPFANPVEVKNNYAGVYVASDTPDFNYYQRILRNSNLLDYYSTRKIWRGRFIWNTNTNEGKCGAKVKVPTNAGGTFTGYVQKSTLSFSGASVVADVEVLGDLD